MIVQRLLKIQNQKGYLPAQDLKDLAEELGEPLYRIEEISSFFPAFRRERPPGLLVRVCRDMTCHLRGAPALTAALSDPRLTEQLTRQLQDRCKLQGLPMAEDCGVAVEGVSCLGRCDRAPAVWIETQPPQPNHHALVFAGRNAAELGDILLQLAAGQPTEPDADIDHPTATNGDAARSGSTPYPAWEIDCYRDKAPRPPDPKSHHSYEAARAVADFIRTSPYGRLVRPPSKEEEKAFEAQNLFCKKDGKYDPEAFVRERHPLFWRLKQSNLLGMGGAGAPAYQKWYDVWTANERNKAPWETEKYIVANGDESEPGTFKDRELLLRLPHLLVEGMIVAGLLTGASQGFVYIRHEYHEQIAAVEAEIERAERLGACGDNVFESGATFRLQVFESPGGYICGEQSALIEAMEDRRSQPRNRPPALEANGFRDKPTVVNNIETLSWVPSILLNGRAQPDYATAGWQAPETTNSPAPIRFAGRRLFSVSGDVNRPGVYEVPVGLPLGELLDDPIYCGGVAGEFSVLAPSGPSGGLLPAKLPINPKVLEKVPDDTKLRWFVEKHLPLGSTHLDLKTVPLDLQFWRTLNSLLRLPVEMMLGAGIVVYAGKINALDHAANFSRFFRNESCGKCVPCRLGSEKLVRLGTSLLAGKAKREAVLPMVQDIYKTMQQTSICGLGYVAPIPLRSALEFFPDDR